MTSLQQEKGALNISLNDQPTALHKVEKRTKKQDSNAKEVALADSSLQ